MPLKAVIFDYIGTLVNCRGYNMQDSENKLYGALFDEDFAITKEKFLEEYNKAHQKYRIVRYEQHKEVTNAIWVAEALCNLGFKVVPSDYRIQDALNVFFKDFIETLELRDGAKKLVTTAAARCRVGLISNFTYAPVIYKSLRRLRFDEPFQTVVVSEAHGWRKPSKRIFESALTKLQVKPSEAVYIGDSPIEDIKGAKDAGLKTVFVSSQFNTLKDLSMSKIEADFVAKNLTTVSQMLKQILNA
jgi:putative hydrolase of the HAD superfamily